MKSRSFRYGFTYKCASCGKEFWVADPSQWIYKNANSFKMYCSYTCYRTWQKERESKQKNIKNKKPRRSQKINK